MEGDLFFVQKGEGKAARRTISIRLVSGADYVTPVTGFAGTKANLSLNSGTSAASSAGMTQTNATSHPGLARLVLTATEVGTLGVIDVTVSANGYFGRATVLVVDFDPFAEGAVSDKREWLKRGMPA